MIYRMSFILPGLPKTTNSGNRAHWAVKVKEANKWKQEVYWALICRKDRMPPRPLARARLTLTRCSSSEPDFDGLVSSFKHIIDGMVECKLLVNDKPSVVGQPQYRWAKAPRGKGFVTIQVEGEI
jgi:hypothetical protein